MSRCGLPWPHVSASVIIPRVDLPTKARQALEVHDWANAFDILTILTETSTPSADDLDALAQAAWWLGRLDVSADAHERAHQEFVALAT